MPSLSTESRKAEKKYSKLLNNLLDIRGRDQTIFTKINNTNSFDVYTKFGSKIQDDILNKVEFNINLEEQDIPELLKQIISLDDPEAIIALYEKFNEKLFANKKLLLRQPDRYDETKKELITKLQEKLQKTTTRWKQFIRKVIDTNIQDNIWPLHMATLFVSIKTNRREIYAPLLLKETRINMSDSKVIVKGEGSWKINEKLLFLLNDQGYSINNIDINNIDINNILKFIGNELGTNLSVEKLMGKFSNQLPKDIQTKIIEFKPGLVLGLFKPSGGNLRKTMLEIIDNDEVDEIIEVDVDKNIYEEKLKDYIKNESENIFRIQKSNYSQDKALISSLIQDTIIWGPPGTGKSQVISNIIANIMMKQKTAIVMSQKKAALDVLKKRLGKVSCFALFILNDNKMVKSEFYKPLQEFVDMIETSNSSIATERHRVITKDEITALNLISHAKNNGYFNQFLNLAEHLGKDSKSMEKVKYLDNALMYPPVSIKLKEFTKILAESNNIMKKGFFLFKKYPKNLISSAITAFNINTLHKNIDINKLKNLESIDSDVANQLIQIPDKLKKNHTYKSDEDYIASEMGKKILEKIKKWKIDDKNKYIQYKKFAAAVRAARRLPYKFANDHMSIIKEIFPVIVTTPETSFINWKRNSFDYAVLDESSQMFLEIGLPILYLAKTKILAGDTEQMQPSRWFAIRDDVEEEEEDIVENADSLLDYALDKGVYKIMLNQNFRSSAASLMSFSSKQFYKSSLEVADNNGINTENAIEVININGNWEGGVNRNEAYKAIEIAKENLSIYKKIIILTFNSNQRQYIEKIILEDIPVLQKAMEDEQLMIRNIENIQGDEADLVIASIVYDETTSIGSTYVSRSGGKNALNVAISRAKEKMIVIKSVNSNNIRHAKSEDYNVFRKWLSFLDLPYNRQREYSIPEDAVNHIEILDEDVDSKFEQDVIDFIKENILLKDNLKLTTQFPVGSKKIDIAILDEESNYKLGIEVDGYKYHGGLGYDKYLDDISRQEFIESKGYSIYRIKEIDWKMDRDKIKNDLMSILNK